MPGAVNRPYSDLLSDGQFRATEALRDLIAERVADDQALVCSCGSGVTACVVALAATVAGHQGPISVYDGSWTEWGSAGTCPSSVTPRPMACRQPNPSSTLAQGADQHQRSDTHEKTQTLKRPQVLVDW